MAVFKLAGAEGFEPPSPVLETGSLAVELTPLNAEFSGQGPEISFILLLPACTLPLRLHLLISVI